MAEKKYSIDDILKIFNKLNKRIDELQCFVRECCAKIPVNVGTGFGLFKKLNQNKWEFKSLLPGTGISISETNNEVIITSTVPAVDCQDIDNCLGISTGGDPNKYLNQQGNFQTIVVPPSFIQSVSDTANIDLTVTGTDLSADLTNTTVTPNTYGDATNIPQITVDQKGRVTSVVDIPITIPPNFIDSISDTATVNLTVTGTTLSADFASMNISQFTNNSNYITLISLSGGTGISYNNLTGVITNSAPDQTVVLTQGGTTTITGTYPNFTISSADQYTGTVTSVSGTGTVSGLTLSGTVTNSGNITLGGTLSLTSSDITTGLGYTPEDVANKSTNTALGTSNTLYPSQNAVKTYVDNTLSSANTAADLFNYYNFI